MVNLLFVFVLACFSLSESFFMVKGAALFLQQGSSTQGPRTPTHHKNAGNHHGTTGFRLTSVVFCSYEMFCLYLKVIYHSIYK